MQLNDHRLLNQSVLESLLHDHVHAVLLLRDRHVEEADHVTVDIEEVDREPDRRREEGAREVAVVLVVDLQEGDHLEGVDPEAVEGLHEGGQNQNRDPNLQDVAVEVDRATDAEEKDQALGQLLDRLAVARRDQNRDLNLAQHRPRRNHRDDQPLVRPIVHRPRKRRKIKIVNVIRIRTRKKIRIRIKVRKKKRRKKNKKMKRNRTTRN